MNPLSRAALRCPGRTLAAVALLAAAAAPGLVRLRLRTDGGALIPPQAPAAVYDRQVRRWFGVRDPLAVVVRPDGPEGIFRPSTLRRVRDLTAALAGLDGVGADGVVSLATERGFRFRPGTLQRQTLLDPLPMSPAAIAGLRSDLARVGAWDGLLIGRAGRSAAVVVGVPPGVDRTAFYRRVRAVAAAAAGSGDRIEVVGAAAAEALLGSHILADLGVPAAWLSRLGEPPEGADRADPAGAPADGTGLPDRLRPDGRGLAAAAQGGDLPAGAVRPDGVARRARLPHHGGAAGASARRRHGQRGPPFPAVRGAARGTARDGEQRVGPPRPGRHREAGDPGGGDHGGGVPVVLALPGGAGAGVRALRGGGSPALPPGLPDRGPRRARPPAAGLDRRPSGRRRRPPGAIPRRAGTLRGPPAPRRAGRSRARRAARQRRPPPAAGPGQLGGRLRAAERLRPRPACFRP